MTGKAMHFLGLLSDGNVHSNIHHLIALLRQAHKEGVKKAYCHILLDGRDVPATSALEYVDMLEKTLAELNTQGCDYAIASGGGRMQVTMDRYEANWAMVEKGWRTHVQGQGRMFASAREAIETYRAETGCIDQDLPAFVIARDGKPVATIANGDSVILFNFRGDRAQEISLAFDRKDFDKFDRGDYTGVKFAGMLQYDGRPEHPRALPGSAPRHHQHPDRSAVQGGHSRVRPVRDPEVRPCDLFLERQPLRQGGRESGSVRGNPLRRDSLRAGSCHEVQGNHREDGGEHGFQEIPVPALQLPNGDMVGHTGVMEAVVYAVECVDNGLKAIVEAADKYGYTLLVTADHGNADQMTETKKARLPSVPPTP